LSRVWGFRFGRESEPVVGSLVVQHEEKIIATVQDIEPWPIPGVVVIEGSGS